MSSREELDTVDAKESAMASSSSPFNGVRAQSTSCLDLSSSQKSEKVLLEKNGGHKSMYVIEKLLLFDHIIFIFIV